MNVRKDSILRPGVNCWRIETADRVRVLVDGADYFEALGRALPLARRQILILAWDIYSELRLRPKAPDSDPAHQPFCAMLNTLAANRRGLRIHILAWDFSMLFAFAREWLPIYRFDWRTHRRVKFYMDDQAPRGASHHQKVVVIDDALAFAGGIDLTRGRWDTSAHVPDDPERESVDGTTGRPYHDVQMAVSGPIAGALGELARTRWRYATKAQLKSPECSTQPLWPTGLEADFEQVEVAVARTQPGYRDQAEVREVEQLFIDAIAAAQKFIYIENQYFTNPSVTRALCERLGEPEGPEVILNLPLATEGWLSQQSMDVLRVYYIQQLRNADAHNRLRVYYPHHPKAGSAPINLHAKVMVIDDRLLRVGSANINNRSMGLDTECDLAIEARGERAETTAAGIARVRNRLLAEHLDTNPEAISEMLTACGSLIGVIEALATGQRRLRPLEPELTQYSESVLTEHSLVDPEQPMAPDRLLQTFLPKPQVQPKYRRLLKGALVVLGLIALAAGVRLSPVADWFTVDQLTGWVRDHTQGATGGLVMVGLTALGGLIMVPLTALIIAAALVFGPVAGFFYALTGATLSAILGYGIGAALGRGTVRSLAGTKLNRLSQKLAARGVLTTTFVRLTPVAPFTVVNLVAGASHLRFRDYLLGTALGMAPGMAGVILLTDRVAASIRAPDPTTLASLGLTVAVVFGLGYWLTRKARERVDAAES
ncbi:MAG: VTT domain-containing protein [Pseudomonadota bacterium]|nr:VTT domain-containing protein [Pseudomonadota bacterium]